MFRTITVTPLHLLFCLLTLKKFQTESYLILYTVLRYRNSDAFSNSFFSEFTLRPELSNLAFHPWYLRYNSSSLSTICRSSASIFNNTSSPSPAFSTLQQNDWKKWYKCRRWVEYPIKGKDGSSHAQCIRLHHL